MFWGEFARREPKAHAKALTELAGWYAAGKIKPVIERRLPMRELRRAFELMASRQVRCKLVLHTTEEASLRGLKAGDGAVTRGRKSVCTAAGGC